MGRSVQYWLLYLATIVVGILASTIATAQTTPPCIEGKIAYHVHPQLTVVEFILNQNDPRGMDTTTIIPPNNLGLPSDNGGTDSCAREIHTHGLQPDGGHPELLHTEATAIERIHYLGEFLALWYREDPKIVRKILADDVVVLVADETARFVVIPTSQVQTIPLQNDKKILIILPPALFPKTEASVR